jgi:hypothetical protein
MIVTGPENISVNTKFHLIKGPFKTGFIVFLESARDFAYVLSSQRFLKSQEEIWKLK